MLSLTHMQIFKKQQASQIIKSRVAKAQCHQTAWLAGNTHTFATWGATTAGRQTYVPFFQQGKYKPLWRMRTSSILLKVDCFIITFQVLNYGSFALYKVLRNSSLCPPHPRPETPFQTTTLFIVIKAKTHVAQSKAPNSAWKGEEWGGFWSPEACNDGSDVHSGMFFSAQPAFVHVV